MLDAASLVRLALLVALWSAALLVFVADTLAWYQIVLALWGGVAGLFIHGGKCIERTSWSLSTLRRSKAGLSWGASLPPPPHTTYPSSSASHQASVFAKLLPSLAADADELALLAEGADAMRRAQRMV